MKVLLIHPPAIGDIPEPPLGIGYIGSYLDKLGYHVRIIDMSALKMNFDDLKKDISEFKPDVAGVSFLTPQYNQAVKCFRLLKSSGLNIVTVAGGAHASALPEETLAEEDIDFAVTGEGELTMAELVDAVNKGDKSFENIKGLGFKRGKEIIINPHREFISDLDSLPMPLWKDLAKGEYILFPTGFKQEVKYFTIMSGRGCPFKCNFCGSGVVFRRVYRARSAENVFKEVKWLYDNYDASYIHFGDDTFTMKKANVIALCKLIIESGIKIVWQCNARVDTIDPEVLSYMKQAGCHQISYGVESGDPEILRLIKKNISLQKVKEAVANTRKAGIDSHAYFMVGNLGETWESVDRTISFIEELDADTVSCAIIVPFPGTEVYEIAREKGWLKETNWDRFNATSHHTGYHLPVMRTEAMSQEELVEAYYKVINRFLVHKIKKRYGVRFYFNPIFYKQEVMKRIRAGGITGLTSILMKGILRGRLFSFSR